MHRLRRHHISFKNAYAGIEWVFTTQPNFRVHIFLSIVVLLLAVVFQVTIVEFSILSLTIAFGLGIEMVNTAIEAVTDLITTEWRQEAKIAKDVAAGMMLVAAIGALLVGVSIFLPRIWALWY